SISHERFEDFCLGTASVRPERDGYVRVVVLEVVSEARGGKAWVEVAVQLRAAADGRIHGAHRADAFADEVDGALGVAELLARRNEVVRWNLGSEDAYAVAQELHRRRRGVVSVDLSSG